MPTLLSLPPLGLAHGEEGLVLLLPQLGFSPALLQGAVGKALASPGSAGAAELATIPAPGRLKGSCAPAAAARAGGAGWRSKSLPFSQAQSLASPRLGPSATAGAVKSRLPLA